MAKRTGEEPRQVTTVRFRRDLMDFIRSRARAHPQGMAGVINDAVALYRDHIEERGKKIRDGIPAVG